MNNLFRLVFLVLMVPVWTLAQQNNQASNINDVISNVKGIFNALIGLLFVIVTVYFIWNLIKLITSDDADKQKIKDKSVYSFVVLVIIVSVWGIVSLITNSLGLDTTGSDVDPSDLIDF